MPGEVRHSPPLHRPGEVTTRPKGILKNPSFSSQGGQGSDGQQSPTDPPSQPPSAALNPQEAKEITIQNTLQNAGHRRSSSAARRNSASRRHSSLAGGSQSNDDDPERMRLKWDEANLYLAEQESGGRMKITEPKTPFQYGDNAMDEDEEEDVSIDPRFVNVDEVDLAKNKVAKKSRESEIPGLELGDPEDETAGAGVENDRIVQSGSSSRDVSKEKHVSVGGPDEIDGQPGMPMHEAQEKHKQFEEQRKKHYEMRNVKDMLGHPEDMDADDDDDIAPDQKLPSRGVNGRP